ncbi:MAG: sodium-dependent transporter [Lachnospiraceae bacterium]|nr:sodium-dependent transporter [Lachnospiraceae bacterium]
MENNRGQWGSNLGFLLAAMGSAIGLGNLWGFPYKMGANGGLPFLIIYLVMVICCGVIVMGIEMAIGRKTNKSPILALADMGKNYKVVGLLGVLSSFLIMGFYNVLIGYSVRYAVGFFIEIFSPGGGFAGMDGGTFFGAFTGDVGMVVLYTFITFLICLIIVSIGIKGGIEKFNKIGIPALFVLLIGISIYNFTLPGSFEGLEFMFTSKGLAIAGTEFNFFRAVRTAGSQTLFSLSLGMGCMITYGSYLSQDSNISKNAWIIPAADTLAAVLAGIAIFPAVFAMGQAPNAGPGLLFITMHNTFTSMGYIGNIVGVLFYLLVIFAGTSSAISLMEVATSDYIDRSEKKNKPISRKKATFLVSLIMFVLSLWVCYDQLGAHSSWLPFAEGSKDILDLYDFFSEGLFMPIGSIAMCIIIGWKIGFKWMVEEIEKNGNKFYSKKFFEICIKYITPILMTFVLISLAVSFFGK